MQGYLDVQRERVRGSLRDLSPNRRTLRNDLIAGFTFAAVNIPQGLAYALMAGITPINGLYTLMIATPLAALFTGSALMNVSSTGALSASVADILTYFPSAQRLAAMGMLVVLMGCFHLLLGLLRLGWIMRFVPNSVMVGFISGVAVNIILGQIADFTGYASRASNRLLQLADTMVNGSLIRLDAVTIGAGTILIILLLERTRLRAVAIIAALLLTSAVALLFRFPNVPFVRDIAEIPRAIPQPTSLSWRFMPAMIVPALSAGILALVQGAAVGQSFPNPNGRYGNVNRDFIGQGLANIATGFFQGLPAGGSASGTAVLVGAGARSRWANLFAGLFTLVIVLTLGGLVELVAMPALAGLLIVIGARMLNQHAIASVWQTSPIARASGLVTFIGTLMIPLQYAVFLGVGVAVLINLFQQAESVRLVELVWSDTQFPIEQPSPRELPSNAITYISIYGSLFFAAAAYIDRQLPDVSNTRNAVLILGLRGHQEVGSTWIAVLERYVRQVQATGNRLILVGVSEAIARQLEQTGAAAVVGAENIYRVDARLGYALAQAHADAVRWLAVRGVTVHRPTIMPTPDARPIS